jgi:quinol-cytochrome oxidoreductase complex cytochrome b subunit
MRNKKFYPDYLAEIIGGILIAFEILIVLALLDPPAIGRQIDFTKQFQPRPEWYFLWLYQLVRYFPGKFAFVGAVLIPLTLAGLLLLMPYIDRGRKGRVKAVLTGAAILLAFVFLTLLSVI